MKKKILGFCLVVSLAAAVIMGGTLAYFTDTDAQTNEFTVGNIKVDLFEDFNTGNLPLIPAVEVMDEQGNSFFENAIEKEVYVKNIGDQNAYIRVHIAVPAVNDCEGNNAICMLHSNLTVGDGKWNWSSAIDGEEDPSNSADWNMYGFVRIGGVNYKVYVATYETALKPDETTVDAIGSVYMAPATTQEDIASWPEGWNHIYVVTEAVQADGFTDAYTALNTAFGTPGSEGYTAPDFTAHGHDQTFIEMTSAEGK